MTDMLVKLYELPEKPMTSPQVEVRRAMAAEKAIVTQWAEDNFNTRWASEVEVSFSQSPIACWIALSATPTSSQLCGFACIETTAKGFFGPTGVSEDLRRQGIGKSLLLHSLHDLHDRGYAYGIIGGAGHQEFYKAVVGATEIQGSDPGIYNGMLRAD